MGVDYHETLPKALLQTVTERAHHLGLGVGRHLAATVAASAAVPVRLTGCAAKPLRDSSRNRVADGVLAAVTTDDLDLAAVATGRVQSCLLMSVSWTQEWAQPRRGTTLDDANTGA